MLLAGPSSRAVGRGRESCGHVKRGAASRCFATAPPPLRDASDAPLVLTHDVAEAESARFAAAPQPLAAPSPPPRVLHPVLQSIPPRIRGLILLNVLCALFGSNVAVVKEAQEHLGPVLFSTGRFALSALAFSPFLPAAFKSRPTLRAGAELGLISAAGYAAQAWGLGLTSASHTAFLGSFTVLLVPLLAGATGSVVIPTRTWVATGVALLGIGALELGGGASSAAVGAPAAAAAAASYAAAAASSSAASVAALHLPPFLSAGAVGDAAALLSATFFAIQLLRTERFSSSLAPAPPAAAADARPQGGDAAAPAGTVASAGAAPLVAVQLATLALCFAAAAAYQLLTSPHAPGSPPSPPFEFASLPWGAWLFTGLVSTAGSLWAELEALRDVSAPDAALVYSAEPLWGATAAATLLGERWSSATWVGAALILAASLYGQSGAAEEGGGSGGGGEGGGGAPGPVAANKL